MSRLEEIFLRPPGEKRHRHPAHLPLVIGREHRGLMARFLPLPHFPQPKTVAQTNASFGQFQLHLLPMAPGVCRWHFPQIIVLGFWFSDGVFAPESAILAGAPFLDEPFGSE